MICVAITGGIGSGKSYISAMLEERGIPVYNADTESKRLTSSNVEIRSKLMALLGEEIYANGELNKPMLASYLFASTENAVRINGIIHPVVKEDFKRWLTNHTEKEITAFESAILYEAGFEDSVDAVLVVFAPRELRLERAMKRDNATEAQIRARIAAQMNDEEKCSRADYVIYTDGRIPLEEQLSDLIKHIKTNK